MDISFENLSFLEEMYASSKEFREELDSYQTRGEPSSEMNHFFLRHAYRKYGHLMAHINPLQIEPLKEPAELSFNHTQEGERLKSIYCNRIGYEYVDICDKELEKWLQEEIEKESNPTKALSIDQKKMILHQLNRSELFESFIQTKYTGQKRFSLEGAETLIPMLEACIELLSNANAEQFVIGMAHRGRLNVLSNILNKSYSEIFSEFEEDYIPFSFEGSGDVKYHKGFTSEVTLINGKKVKILLSPNPSHLESVDPVVEGEVKALQVMKNDEQQDRIIPILVHGDAAISGQGVVYETLQFSKLQGYDTGGTLHFVINNQVGFTASPHEMRSTPYCTDIAKAFNAPVFHVNAEDPESCVFVTLLASKMRQRFHCDVFIDLLCYRKYGHNEADEPAYTQPQQYEIIRKKRPIREIYRDLLIKEGVLEQHVAENLEKEFVDQLHEEMKLGKESLKKEKKEHKKEERQEIVDTKVSKEILEEIGEKIFLPVNEIEIHPKLKNLLDLRLKMVRGEKPIDWGVAELLAYGTLLWDGKDVRISGQDSVRGTFSHRHAKWVDQKNGQVYSPLSHLRPVQGRFDVLNSSLSEYAVLGFEFGYSIANSNALVIWEAQFGDFCNGAQVVIDQFIATAEQKWGQAFGLTLFLPHGYEGQGPEHSSARMERFLTLAGENNMEIVNPTTPAQMFHLLRKQALRKIKKPLIIFTPKGLLRHPMCTSEIKDLVQGKFQEVIDDQTVQKEKVQKCVFMSGRIYFDLLQEREKHDKEVSLIRIEELYPMNLKKLEQILSSYTALKEAVWIQEEPINMGAWEYVRPYLGKLLENKNILLKVIARKRSASPAVGALSIHKKQLQELFHNLFKNDQDKHES